MKRRKAGSKMSAATFDQALREPVLSVCALCGDWFEGTLRESRDWFSAHRCSPGPKPTPPPPPEAGVRITPRRQITPRVALPTVFV